MTIHRAESLESSRFQDKTDVSFVWVGIAQVHGYDAVIGVLYRWSGFFGTVSYAFAPEGVLRTMEFRIAGCFNVIPLLVGSECAFVCRSLC